MKKKLAIGVLGVALLVGGATTAFGATDQTKLNEVKDLYKQMFTIQKQIVDKEVEAGALTQDQATAIKSNIDQRQQYHDQAIDNGQIVGPGMGMGPGGGCGRYGATNGTITPGQGYGPGYGMRGGGRWGGVAGTTPSTQAPAAQSGTTN